MIRLAAVAALVLVLAGCSSPAAPPDLDGALSQDDAPLGMTWTASGTELTAGEDLHSVEHLWEDAGGDPAACFPLYLLAYGVRTDDAGSGDRTVEIGYFTPATGQGAIMVNARDFPDESTASAFVQYALETVSACPGYTVGEFSVAPGGFAVGRFDGGHGITGAGRGGDVAARFAVVHSGRTIVVVDAFLPLPSDVDLVVVDEVARAVLAHLDG